MPRRKGAKKVGEGKTKNGNGPLAGVKDYRYEATKRKNIPPAKIAAEGVVPLLPKIEYFYSPRRPPSLQFDPTGAPDQLPELLAVARQRSLTEEEAKILAQALRNEEPWLEWAGKREAKRFEVDPVVLQIHERISTKAILKVAARQDIERSLFGDPEQAYHEAVQFYKWDIDWTNRLILGDSLQVMSSLARREDLAGKVQMIYIDPPYGIKFASNFQPEISKHDVKDKEEDLTREPEMVKAFRDTWHLGTHSYLTYLRDRLIVAKELLADMGSIFVQIGDDNVHLVRNLLDEVFRPENFVNQIAFLKTTSSTSTDLSAVHDSILWYRRSEEMKFRPVFEVKKSGQAGASAYRTVLLHTGEMLPAGVFTDEDDNLSLPMGAELVASDNYTSQSPGSRYDVSLSGRKYRPEPGYWKTDEPGMMRILNAERLLPGNKFPGYLRKISDFPAFPLGNVWTDTLGQNQFGGRKIYSTQTAIKVIRRCMLMTTDPGDLVLDSTCGSGTTAYVAEQWGRRWITIDTSRVAVAITRQRMLTCKFDYYKLRDEALGVSRGFVCRTLAHIKPSTITQNTHLDPIFAKHEPILEEKLSACNAALTIVPDDTWRKLAMKLMEKQKAEGRKAITDADRRRWQLPVVAAVYDRRNDEYLSAGQTTKKEDQDGGHRPPLQKGGWEHWNVPFDTDPEYPKELADAVTEYRKAWRAKMDEVNACIAANAEREELVDQPETVKGVLRVSGPFTVEAVQPSEMSLGDVEVVDVAGGEFGGGPEELQETFGVREVETRIDQEAKNIEAYLEQMIRLLRMDGVRFPDNKQMRFTRLEQLRSAEPGLQAEGRWLVEGNGAKEKNGGKDKGEDGGHRPPLQLEDADPEGKATVCVAFGSQYGPVTAKMVEDVIRSANRMGYDDLVIAGFSFDGPAQAVIEEAQRPKLRIHAAHIRPDVNPGMNGLLKEQPGSQLFTVFGQPRTRLEGPDRNDYLSGGATATRQVIANRVPEI